MDRCYGDKPHLIRIGFSWAKTDKYRIFPPQHIYPRYSINDFVVKNFALY